GCAIVCLPGSAGCGQKRSIWTSGSVSEFSTPCARMGPGLSQQTGTRIQRKRSSTPLALGPTRWLYFFRIEPLGLTRLRRSAAILDVDRAIPMDRCMVLKIGGYYYHYEDEYAVLASPQEAKPSIPEDSKPTDVDISVMIEEIQAD